MDPFLSPGWKLHDYLQHKEGPTTPAPVYKISGKAKQVCFKSVDLDRHALSPSLENSSSSDAASLSSEFHSMHHSSSDLIFVSESSVVHSERSSLTTPPPAYLARLGVEQKQARSSFNPYIW